MFRQRIRKAREVLERARAVGRRTGPHAARPPTRADLDQAAAGDRWPDGPATTTFLDLLQESLDRAPGTPPRVLVATGRRPHRVRRLVAAYRPDARVTELDPTAGVSEQHVLLADQGPFDLVVDDTRVGPGRADLFQRTFFRLRPGGRYLVVRFGAGTASADEETVLAAASRLAGLRARGVEALRDHRPRTEAVQARAVDGIVVDGPHLVVRNRLLAMPKLHQEETDALLALRGEAMGTLLQQLPATTLEARSTVHEDTATDQAGPPSDRLRSFRVPPLSLRGYRDPVCGPGQLITSDGILLADSYRHLRHWLRNRNTAEVNAHYALAHHPLTDPRPLPGSYFYLDSEFRGHYGHALSEQLSRLWAWERAKREDPDLKVLVSRTRWGQELFDFETRLYGAAGVDPEDVVLIDGPVRPERVLCAAPMYSQPHYVHPDLPALWARVGARLAGDAPDRDYPRRVFCGRRSSHRACTNAAEVEQLFADHGFAVVHPEDLPLTEQVRMFSEAEVVAGYSGSALFTIALAQRPLTVVMITSTSYAPKNEYLMCAAVGHELHVVHGRSKVPMPAEGWSWDAFNADFAVDLDREGARLRDLLEALPPAVSRPRPPG